MGYGGYCKPCNREHNREWMYGMTNGQYEEMLAAQGGLCAICERPPVQGKGRGDGVLHVDHDHATGKVRALLCVTCNQGIGQFQDDIERLERAIAYLKEHA